MPSSKPSQEEYLRRRAEALGFPPDLERAGKVFEFNMRAAYESVLSGPIFAGIFEHLKQIRTHYANGNPDLLFYPPSVLDDVKLYRKPFSSALNKLYRVNVLYNRLYKPDRNDTKINAENIYESIEDLLRSRLICKYMDGPRFVSDELKQYCERNRIAYKLRALGTEGGYYAWHFYFRAPAEIMRENVAVVTCPIWVEIQLSTQLAEVITSLTHGLYEQRREGIVEGGEQDWRWEANSQRFRSAYIGHGLHLLEGIIQTFRDDVLQLGKRIENEQSDDSGNMNDTDAEGGGSNDN